LAAKFAPVAEALGSQEEQIVAELIAVQGKPADIGGYYKPDAAKIEKIMRPSVTLNAVIDSLN
jgi:isocitrate dehydrogenase